MADRHIIRRFLTELLQRVQGNVKNAEDLDTAVCWAIWKLDSLIGIKELEVLFEFQTQDGVLAQVINVAPFFIAQVREVREKTCGYNLKFWKEYMPFVLERAPKGAPKYYWFDPPLMSENLNYYTGYAHQMLTIWLYPVPDKQYTLEILMKVLPLTLQDTQDAVLPAVFEKYYVPLFYLATAELFRLNQMYQEAEREENEALKIASIYKKMFAPPTPSIIPLKYQLFKRRSDIPCAEMASGSSGGGDGSGGSGGNVILTLIYDSSQGNISLNPSGTPISANQYRYPVNTTVQLTPSPNTGFEFGYWYVVGENNFYYSPLSLTLDTDKTIQAFFTNQKVLVFDYGNLPGGQVKVNGTFTFSLPYALYQNIGDTITIEAVVPPGYSFEKWEFYARLTTGSVGDLLQTITTPTYTFTVDRSYVIKMYVDVFMGGIP
jgi:hypothetical protein